MVELTSDLIKENQALRAECETARKQIRNAILECVEMRLLSRSQISQSILSRRSSRKLSEQPVSSESNLDPHLESSLRNKDYR